MRVNGILSEDYIRERLRKTRRVVNQQSQDGSKKAAVLVPFCCIDGEWKLLLTHRTQLVETHKDQVSFPGGAVEAGDDSPEQTALRDTSEEIGIGEGLVTILGRLGELPTAGYAVTPVVGVIQWPAVLTISKTEVSRVFSVPYDWLADQQNWDDKPYRLPNGGYGPVTFYHEFDGERIWGITAKIIRDLVQTLS